MNLAPFKNGGINITGFQLLNYTTLLKPNANNRAWRSWDWPTTSYSHQIPVSSLLRFSKVHLACMCLKSVLLTYQL